ncbi:TPA: hypothetical protein ACLQU7_005222 [Bacillus tropicus]|uniref:hypothetical protein n=1 Tax=Bacillus cereus group TaxID=86661 RepID=UPI00003CC2C5|nr:MULTISPECIES: hypothetical protein [Bacillus cereus group]AJI02642.1 hypothetical protein AQ16_5874 [Bacillus cereus G9241]AIY72788.1 hypothetical protein NT98_5890 [Bacillus cereus]EAL11051.1 hypothetical protein protein [Bacillus cereus G9241]EAL12081.1 conserved hypothetical protein protein [Bacillus cereus G9241]PFC37571.1 hypothetical protein CN310_14435 [Bacillus cereus]
MNFFILDEHYKKAELNGINRRRLQERIYRYDWDIERATTQPVGTKKMDFDRKHGDWMRVAEQNGISRFTFYSRLKRGWSYHLAATKPPGKQGNRYDENGELKEVM